MHAHTRREKGRPAEKLSKRCLYGIYCLFSCFQSCSGLFCSGRRSFPSLLPSNLCSAGAGLPPYRQACVLLFIYFLDVSGLIITEETHQSRSLFPPLATFYIFCLFKKRKKRKIFLESPSEKFFFSPRVRC